MDVIALHKVCTDSLNITSGNTQTATLFLDYFDFASPPTFKTQTALRTIADYLKKKKKQFNN